MLGTKAGRKDSLNQQPDLRLADCHPAAKTISRDSLPSARASITRRIASLRRFHSTTTQLINAKRGAEKNEDRLNSRLTLPLSRYSRGSGEAISLTRRMGSRLSFWAATRNFLSA